MEVMKNKDFYTEDYYVYSTDESFDYGDFTHYELRENGLTLVFNEDNKIIGFKGYGELECDIENLNGDFKKFIEYIDNHQKKFEDENILTKLYWKIGECYE